MRLIILLIAIAAIALLAVPITAGSARLVWNTSASAPAGVYWIEHGQWRVGDRVAVQLSPELSADLDRRGVLSKGKLLIKHVVAGEGGTVCRLAERVTHDGTLIAIAKPKTASGQRLPDWQACRRLSADDVFLLGDTDNSYDGRYFGVTQRQDIVGRVSLIFPLGG